MSFENKYRVHEVAKDFGKQTKDITQILTTYATTPKNHMQVLSDKELSIVFEYMTQHNQVADMQASLATAQPADRFQFLRLGYFCADSKDSKPGALVFNRAVSLKDGFKK